MTDKTYASNIDDLVAEIGKLNHKRRVAADMISELLQDRYDKDLEIANRGVRIDNLKKQIKELRAHVEGYDRINALAGKYHNDSLVSHGSVDALKWTIKELTKK